MYMQKMYVHIYCCLTGLCSVIMDDIMRESPGISIIRLWRCVYSMGLICMCVMKAYYNEGRFCSVVYVHVCARLCFCVCARACVWVCVGVGVCVCVCVCVW